MSICFPRVLDVSNGFSYFFGRRLMSNAVFSIKYCTFWVYSAIIYFFPYTIVGDSSRLINDGGYIMLPCDDE